jgi:hypothetical protein
MKTTVNCRTAVPEITLHFARKGQHDTEHLPITARRPEVITQLSGGNIPDNLIDHINIYLSKELPMLEHCRFIYDVTSLGIIFTDEDCDCDGYPWRTYLIPASCIEMIRTHKLS